MWTTFDQLRERDVFKLVDQPTAGYVIRSLDPLRVESVRWGHQVHDFAPDKPVLLTHRP